MSAKKVDPKVQEWYDALSDVERDEFNKRLVAADRRLADMRMAKSTGKLDERLLIPRSTPKNYDWHRKVNDKIEKDEELDENEQLAALGAKDLPGGVTIKPGGKLPPNKDLSGYIKDMMGDGKVLADFYIEILQLGVKEARKRGVFMNHKLAAAAWLGERGWGKAKGDESDKGITVNIVNHSDVNVQDRPPIQASAIEQDVTIDNDAGRDVDLTVVETEDKKLIEAPKDDVEDIDVDIENFSLR